ncbi:MAG: DUF4384 domain-containing protein, partial [Pseudomonadota bacterium]
MRRDDAAPWCLGAAICYVAIGLLAGVPLARAESEVSDETPAPASVVPLAQAVGEMLRAHCATCHGRRPSKSGTPPADGIGAIDNLDWLASSALVVPGSPDRSRVFAVAQERHAPLAHFTPWGEAKGPTGEDLARLRRWIAGLGPSTGGEGCPEGRAPIKNAELINSALQVTDDFEALYRRSFRFLSLAHLWNGCVSAKRLDETRSALVGALRGLTWRSGTLPVRGVPVARPDGSTTPDVLYAIALGDIGVPAAAWNRAAKSSTVSFAKADEKLRTQAQEAFGTIHAIAMADGFISTAYGDVSLYQDMLRLPPASADLARRLGLSKRLIETPSHRLVVPQSTVTGGPQRLTRYRSRTTTLWLAEDLVRSQPARDANAGTVGARALFRLPNGTPAFANFNGPSNSVASSALRPADCAACHADGPRTIAPVTPSETATAPVTTSPLIDMALSAFASEAAADRIPSPRIRGLDAITFLVADIEAPVGLARAAAELDRTVQELATVLRERAADGDWIARRLSQGQISRAQFVRLRAAIEGAETPAEDEEGEEGHEPRVGGQPSTPTMSRTSVAIWTDRTVYGPGAPLRIHLQASRACYPTVINVDSAGSAIVLYPNGLDEWQPLDPAAPVVLPPSTASYDLRARRTGASVGAAPPATSAAARPFEPGDTQTLHVFCSDVKAPLFAIKPDYTQLVFTILGDWEAFLTSAYDAQANAEDPERLRRRRGAERRGSWRNRRAAAPPML